MLSNIKRLSWLLGLSVVLTTVNAAEVNVYSARKEALIRPLLDTFSERTGITVNLLTGKSNALIQRMKAEGRNTPADLMITVDAGRLAFASSLGLFQPLESDTLASRIPASLRSPDNLWFGLSQRARIIVYHPDRVSLDELADYEDLADAAWAGRICARSSVNIYNQSLLASIIEYAGTDDATAWAKAVRENMARDPQGNDSAQIKAVAAGECDVALVNTYYLGGMLSNPELRDTAAAVRVHFPNQSNRGAHVNISGAGVTKYAKNVAEARQLLEFLVSDDAQAWYAQTNHEYPVVEGVPPSDLVASFGDFKRDALNVSRLGARNAEAVQAFDNAGWE
ncbi:MAG: Fe(3+) ABC transporter substrate-binding protein [Pseudomonadota bacterium]